MPQPVQAGTPDRVRDRMGLVGVGANRIDGFLIGFQSDQAQLAPPLLSRIGGQVVNRFFCSRHAMMNS
jgi:hypothetical protein